MSMPFLVGHVMRRSDNVVVILTNDNQVVKSQLGGYRRGMEKSRGAELALLLLDGFNAMVDEVVAELERQGHPGVTATHEFALRAIDEGAYSASGLGRSLGVSRQAAAKSIAALEELGYVERKSDPLDARRKRLTVTTRGYEMAKIGGAVFDDLRKRWMARLGQPQLEALESGLAALSSAD
jgi:DNA-binding MarR family transcriptional regulator